MVGTLHEEYIFLIISRWILLRMTNVSDKSCRENQNTQFVFRNFCFSENLTVYEIKCKNIVERAGNSWQCGACALHAGYLKLQICSQNM
jgi:hypothetical protein